MVDLRQLHLDWYAWTMGGGPKPAFLKKRIAYYVMGADEWRYADTLEGVTAEQRAYSLSSSLNADRLAAPGRLAFEERASGSPDIYIYDPMDVSTADLQVSIDPNSKVDTRLIKATDGKHLIYESAPFSAPTEVSGFFRLTAWIAIDQLDTDFEASIFEITPSGESILLTNDILRARYRNGLEHAELVRTRDPIRYDFNNFTFTSRLLARGSRLRMILGPRNSIYDEKNYNGGGLVAYEGFKDARPVSVKLYHDAAYPSTLYVPIAQPGK
jgi:putative CocE/NonD family hydrolase